MDWFKRGLGLVIVLALAVATLVFVLENQSVTQLSFLGYAAPQWPVAFLLVLFFVVGALLGVLLGAFVRYRLRARIRKQAAELKRLHTQVQQLQAQHELLVKPQAEAAY